MSLQYPSLISCFIRCFAPLSFITFLLLQNVLNPGFLNFQLTVSIYSLCFFVLLVESLFLFFYKEQTYPQAIELGLMFLSALFLSSLLAIIQAPTALFFAFLFIFIQALSLIFLKKLFQTTVFFVYLSFLFPVFLSTNYENLEQGSFLIPFCFLVLTLMFLYLLVFYFVFDSFSQKTSETVVFDGEHDLILLDFSRTLKPFLAVFSKHISHFETEEPLQDTEQDTLKNHSFAIKKIRRDLNSLNSFISNFIEYIELFFERLTKNVVSLNSLFKDALEDLKNHPKKPAHLNLTTVLNSEKDFKIKASVSHLKQAFKNIIVNAFEAQDSSNENNKNLEFMIHIEAYREWLVIHFIDTGQGIEAEEEQKLFKPFVTKKFGLGGLGLSYAKKVIELHQGDIQIKREEKKTKVIVRFPLEASREKPYLQKQKTG